jgi:hypothetical protein
MKSTEFCYWLQGWFELEEPTSINSERTQLIKNHLNMVFAHEKPPAPFCSFLKGYLTITNPEMIDEKETAIIKQYLNNVFEHVVGEKQGVTKKSNELPKGIQAMC